MAVRFYWTLVLIAGGSEHSENGIVLQAFAALGHSTEPKLIDDPVITSIAKRVNKTPAQVLLAWAVQRGTALLTTSKTPSRIKENFNISTLLV